MRDQDGSSESANHRAQDLDLNDVNISELPAWWQNAIRTFRESGLPAFQPPRFSDGQLKHDVVTELEAEFGVNIRFVYYDNDSGEWDIQVDGETLATVDHRRSREGYSVYGIASDTFEALIRSHHRSKV
jgi:hypothetical protein